MVRTERKSDNRRREVADLLVLQSTSDIGDPPGPA